MKDFHPYALIFPPIEGAEIAVNEAGYLSGNPFAELCADIEAHGLLFPIILHDDGRVLEGRHREIACDRTGIVPFYETFKQSAADLEAGRTYDESALDFVMSANSHRRQLTEDQRAAAAVAYKEHFAVEALKRQTAGKADNTKISAHERRSDTQAAKKAGVPREMVNVAEKLKKTAPADFEAVRKGTKKLKQVTTPKPPNAAKPAKAKKSAQALLLDAASAYRTAIRSAVGYAETLDADFVLKDVVKTDDSMRELRTAIKQAEKRHGSKLHKKADIAVAAAH